ncbi:MAG: hypothetical protein ACRCUY_13220 [Thermoguttaceae bacterium]
MSAQTALPIDVSPQVFVRTPDASAKWLVDFRPIDDVTNPARKLQIITIVDPELKRICVYQQDLLAGTVQLCSVRALDQDLLLDQFNAIRPTPRDLEEEARRLNIR